MIPRRNRTCDETRIVDNARSPIPQTRDQIRPYACVTVTFRTDKASNADRILFQQGDQGIVASKKVANVNSNLMIWGSIHLSCCIRFDHFESPFLEAARYLACASRLEAPRYLACASRLEAPRYLACASRHSWILFLNLARIV